LTEFDKNDMLVQRVWDRLRTLLGAKVFNIKNKNQLEKVAKRYKTLSGYEKSGLIKKSNLFSVIKEQKMQTYVKGYTDKKGKAHEGYYKAVNIQWTAKEKMKLKEYHAHGRTTKQIAGYLGRTPTAVTQKLKKIK